MATFKQRANGSWQAVIRRKGWPPESRTFDKKDDARKWATDTENRMDRGVWVPREEAERMTVYEALENYSKEATPRKKGSAIEMYRIKKWQEHKLAKCTLANLRGSDLASWRDGQLKTGYAPATVRLELALISAVYEHARKDWGLHVDNPARAIKMPMVRNARERRLSAVEERYLLAALDDSGCGDRKNERMGPVVRFAIETAARQGELCRLDWKDVDLKKATARLRDTKNGDDRIIPLSSKAVAILKELQGDVKRISGPLFGLTESALKQSFTRAVGRARKAYEKACREKKRTPVDDVLVNLHFHDLRHEATSRLAEKLAMHELAKVTGHKDTRMLLRYYHPKAEDLAKKLG